MGIDNYYFNNFDSKIVPNNYWDFHLTSDNQGMSLPYATSCNDDCSLGVIIDDDLTLWFDISRTGTTTDGSVLTSLVEWTGVTITPSSGITLSDFGLTGVDNGRVTGFTDTITLTSGDTKMKLYPVNGYSIELTSGGTYVTTNGKYDYPWNFISGTTVGNGCEMDESICLDGGFYQGFFKIDFEAPAPYSATTIDGSSCNSGITTTVEKGDPEAQVYEIHPTTFEKGWTMETWLYPNDGCGTSTGDTTTLNDTHSGNTGFFFYMGTRAENKFQNVFSGETGHETSTGLPLQPNIPVDEGLNGGQDWFSKSQPSTLGGMNPFRNCECTCSVTGTTDSSITSGNTNTHCNQLGENALGFRITDDNRLGWRKVSVTGECRNSKFVITGNTIEEEYTTTSVIPTGNTPTLIQVVYTQGGEKNGLPSGNLKMFVNGRLVLKSKEFIGIQLRALNEWSDKQQGVPYNMSWGGGTQGLVESQTFGGPDPSDSGLLLEENFAGSFLGQLSQLRFYKRPLNVLELRNNLFSECDRYCVRSTFGGPQIIQPGSILCGDCNTNHIVVTPSPPPSPPLVSPLVSPLQPPASPPPVPMIQDSTTIYYGKINKTTIESGDTISLLTNIRNELVGTHLELPSGVGYGYILIPNTMETPSVFRMSTSGCAGFSIPFVTQNDMVVTLSGNQYIYKVYRTFVSTQSSIDVWSCV